MEFECECCGNMFRDRLFDISREYGRVHFRSPPIFDEVEIHGAESIANFCSNDCRTKKRQAVMTAQRVPIPTVRPSLGPVETCAKCSGPVDMSAWHLTFLEGLYDTSCDSCRPIEVDYLAVVCRKCVPSRLNVALTEPISAFHEEALPCESNFIV